MAQCGAHCVSWSPDPDRRANADAVACRFLSSSHQVTTRQARSLERRAATLGIDAAKALATLDEEGKVEFPCEVELTDKDGQRVANATVHWHVRLKSSR